MAYIDWKSKSYEKKHGIPIKQLQTERKPNMVGMDIEWYIDAL
jgi:hypothetical protein